MESTVSPNLNEFIGQEVARMNAKAKNGKNILVIGNGFDLYHEIPTKYYDFVEFTRSPITDSGSDEEKRVLKICEDNPFLVHFRAIIGEDKQWIDCEKEIADVILTFGKLLNQHDVSNTMLNLTSKDYEVGKNLKSYFSVSMHNEIFKFHKRFQPDKATFRKEALLNELKEKLNEVIFVLQYYLCRIYFNTTISKKSKQLESTVFEKVINFNYTYTYKHYDIEDEKVFFIHGRLDDFANMVLGIDDYEKRDLNFVYFKKYFQRIQKRLGTINPEWFIKRHVSDGGITTDKESKSDRVYFFGHSMSNSDGDIIRDIFDRTQQVIIFFLNQGDYEQKIINLIEIFGKDKILKDMHSEFIKFIEIE